ncbi:MAG: hypothetical protein K5868_03070 [Lachnospiraceae bacterium]|nr:hypothetical protein [Lachnospiraceae bacterium]
MNQIQMSHQSEHSINAIKSKSIQSSVVSEHIPTSEASIKKMRIPRSKRYISAIRAAAPAKESDSQMRDSVVNENLSNELIGILGPCAIEGCVIHTIDNMGRIIEHFRDESAIPDSLREGYTMYCSYSGCIAVEVYTHTFCIINTDGSAKLIGR